MMSIVKEAAGSCCLVVFFSQYPLITAEGPNAPPPQWAAEGDLLDVRVIDVKTINSYRQASPAGKISKLLFPVRLQALA